MVIRSHYFEPREIHLGEDDLVVVSCIRNEVARLPYFLEYYRERGVDRFLCVDNGSNDGSAEYLRAQPDVEVFHTTGSYRGSAAGRLWLQELADTYATGHWVLTVDVDELLIYPGCERIPLERLCHYMERRGLEGLFTVMLDMYSDKPFAETTYVPGTPFLDTCQFFETESYSLSPSPSPPFLGIVGGPRGRLYAAATSNDPGPTMRKVPLVKWYPGFSYIRSTHTHRYIPLADLTGALLHFKFFASFEAGMRTEYKRGDRRQNHVYARYIEQIGPDTTFYGEWSHRYKSPSDLVARGVMASSARWRNYAHRVSGRRAHPFDVDKLLPDPPARPVGLESLAYVWPFANNLSMAVHFGLEMPGRRDTRSELVRELLGQIDIVEIEETRVLLRIGEPALHRWQRNGLSVALTVEGRVAGVVAVDGTDDALEIVTDSLEPNVCTWPVDVAKAVGDRPESHVVAYLIDREDTGRPLPVAGESWTPGARDVELFNDIWHRDPVAAGDGHGATGRIERLEDGVLSGWVLDDAGPRDVPITVYVNGRLAVSTVAAAPVEADSTVEAASAGTPSAARSTFQAALPIGYFAELGASELQVDVRIAGTNVVLERSPLRIPADVRDASWHDGSMWRRVAGWRPGR